MFHFRQSNSEYFIVTLKIRCNASGDYLNLHVEEAVHNYEKLILDPSNHHPRVH
jgi:hypothetical protein